jgi:hypothetical protein
MVCAACHENLISRARKSVMVSEIGVRPPWIDLAPPPERVRKGRASREGGPRSRGIWASGNSESRQQSVPSLPRILSVRNSAAFSMVVIPEYGKGTYLS